MLTPRVRWADFHGVLSIKSSCPVICWCLQGVGAELLDKLLLISLKLRFKERKRQGFLS